MRRRCLFGLSFLLLGLGCTAPESDLEESRHRVGTGLFAPYAALEVGSWPSAVAIADINGDGLNEVVMTTDYYADPVNDYQLMVFRPDGAGAMHEIARYPIGNGAGSIAIGDVNGDGRNDVVVAHAQSDTIGILYQNPTGTLDPMEAITTACAALVRVADLNSDGRQDIVAIGWGSDAVELYLQDEQGQLVGPTTYHATHGGYDDLEVGDVNHDGRTDIVVMSGQSLLPNLGVLLQTEQGTFADPVYYSVGGNLGTNGVAIGDVSGDGRQDVIVSCGGNRPTSMLGVFLQNGEGGLDPVQSLPSYDVPRAVVTGDVDGNGTTDVLVLHFGWSRLGVYSQTSAGVLDPEVLYNIPDPGYTPDLLALGDFTEDGVPDVAIAQFSGELVTLRHYPETIPPVVTVGEPTGAVATVGIPLTITWTASDNMALAGFDVRFSADGGATSTAIVECTGLGAEARSCTWALPGPATPTALVRVVARDTAGNTASAIGAFTLVPPPDTLPPSVAVGAPSGGEAFVGLPLAITWTASDNLALAGFDVLYSTDGGTSTAAIAECAGLGAAVRGCTWANPGPASPTAVIRVVARDSSGNSAWADGAFVLKQASLSVVRPNRWLIGTQQTISWSGNLPAGDMMRIELSRNGGGTWESIAASVPNSGSYATTATGPQATDARLRVTWLVNPGTQATTSPGFAIEQGAVTVTYPNTRITLRIGQTGLVSWTHNLGAGATFNVDLSRDGGSTWTGLGSNIAATSDTAGSYAWPITAPKTTSGRVRVTWTTVPGVTDMSNANFVIK